MGCGAMCGAVSLGVIMGVSIGSGTGMRCFFIQDRPRFRVAALVNRTLGASLTAVGARGQCLIVSRRQLASARQL